MYQVRYKKLDSCVKVPVLWSFPPSFISLCHRKSTKISTLERASTLPLKGINPYHRRILAQGIPNNILLAVPKAFQVRLLRVSTSFQPKKFMMPFKAISARDVFDTQEIAQMSWNGQ